MLRIQSIQGIREAGSGGKAVSAGALAICSLSGGLTAAVTVAGRTVPTAASLWWLGVLLGSSLLLAGWALLFALAVHRRARIPGAWSLYLSALCHLPLLAGLGLVQAVYSSDLANHVYSSSVFGQTAYKPLAMAGLVVAPGLLQVVAAGILARRRVAGYLVVAAPVAVALVLRLWNVDWQLPYRFHNDEQNYLGAAMIAWAHGDPNPHRFLNPSLLVYVDTALYLTLGGQQAQNFRVFADAFGHHVWDPTGFYLISLAARIVVALLGTATVPAVYLAAKELFGKRTGLLAAWFMAVAFLHVRNSHYATNDVAATFFVAASFLFAAKLYNSGRRSHYLWAGILGGLATATKYNAGLFALPILVAHLARQERPRLRRGLVSAGVAPLVLSAAASLFGFLLGVPYSILAFGEFLEGFREQLRYGTEPWFGQQLLPVWWMHLTALAHGFGLIPLLLAALGVAVLFRRRPGALAVVAAFPAVYYAFMAGQQLFFARFAIPLLPFAAILAGCGASAVADRLSSIRFGRLLAPALLAIALVEPALYSVQSDLILGREDTRVLADRWLSANFPDQGILLVDDISDLRPNHLWPSRPGLPMRLYNPIDDPTPWKQESRRPVFVAFSSFGYEGYQRGAGDPTVLPPGYRVIEESGHLLASFSPARGQNRVGYSLDDTYTPFWYVMDRDRSGPTVWIYQIDPDR